MDTATITVGTFVFDDVELLDFAGSHEVFMTAGRPQRTGRTSAI